MTVLEVIERYILLVTIALVLLALVVTNAFVGLFVDLGIFSGQPSYSVYGLMLLATYLGLDEFLGGVMAYIAERTHERQGEDDPEDFY